MSNTIINQRLNLEKTNITINDQLNFINNIIENSPYGIFVLNNNELIFQNTASEILSQDNLSSFDSLKILINKNFDNNNSKEDKIFEKNIKIFINKIEKTFFIKSVHIADNSLFDQLIIFNDYTDLISAEKNNAIAELARKISHEIKNPLTPMLLSTEFLETQIEEEELKILYFQLKDKFF